MKFEFTIGSAHPEPIPNEECASHSYGYAYYWTILSTLVGVIDVEKLMDEHGMIPQSARTYCLGVEWIGPRQSRVHMLSVRNSCEDDYHVCIYKNSGHDGSDQAAIEQFQGEFEEEDQILLSLHDKSFFTPSFDVVQRVVIPGSDIPRDPAKFGSSTW